jgi:hypothetical protein
MIHLRRGTHDPSAARAYGLCQVPPSWLNSLIKWCRAEDDERPGLSDRR